MTIPLHPSYLHKALPQPLLNTKKFNLKLDITLYSSVYERNLVVEKAMELTRWFYQYTFKFESFRILQD